MLCFLFQWTRYITNVWCGLTKAVPKRNLSQCLLGMQDCVKTTFVPFINRHCEQTVLIESLSPCGSKHTGLP